MHTKDFIYLAETLTDRQKRLFVLIHNQHKPLSRLDIMALLQYKRVVPTLSHDLNELVSYGFIELENEKYFVPNWVKQLVREVVQNSRIARHIQPHESVSKKGVERPDISWA
jgi:predicted transcriptional regulator